MSERYSRLFALPEDLYSVGSPVVIAAGALLKDNQTGKVIGQLKLRSVSQKAIKAVKVKLHLFDTAGNPIGESVEHSYLDLNAARDSGFGQKSPIAVPEAKTRSYQAAVTEVVFADQSVWTSDEGVWESLEKPTTLSITDPELLKQYQMHYGSGAKYEAKEEKDLWHCTCGALNHEGETCHVCGHSLFELQTVEMEKLTAEKDARLAEAARKAAEEQAATEAQKKKTAKILAIVLPTVCALVAIILLATKVIIPNSKYYNAVKLMDAGSYEEAIVAFEAMDGYKDSVQKIADCELAILEAKYNNAVALMEAENYEEAISGFEALNGYKDSDELLMDCKYNNALTLMNDGDIVKAYETFLALDDYKNSTTMAKGLYVEYEIAKIRAADVGDYVYFGAYEQDGDTSNGKEKIEWLVLDKQDNRALVLSKYAHDTSTYDIFGIVSINGKPVTDADLKWDISDTRYWLNGDFMEEAFSADEIGFIPIITVSDEEAEKNGSVPNSVTNDQLFLLSVSELNKYLTSSDTRKCDPTDAVCKYYSEHVWIGRRRATKEDVPKSWWLRSLGQNYDDAACVDKNGNIIYIDKETGLLVRPAMWIDLGE